MSPQLNLDLRTLPIMDRQNHAAQTNPHHLRLGRTGLSVNVNRQPDFLTMFAILPMIAPTSPCLLSSTGTVHPLHHHVSFARFSPSHRTFLASLDNDIEPTSVCQAMRDIRWQRAMAEEIQALEDNGKWTIIELPRGKKPTGCKWAFKIKRHSDRSIEGFKAKLVAKRKWKASTFMRPLLLWPNRSLFGVSS